MNVNQFIVIFYILFWVVRINGCIRRGRQPILRGPEWFFNVPVRPDFYTGGGRKVLHRYWMRMFIPFAVDIPVAMAMFLSGRLLSLRWLILGLWRRPSRLKHWTLRLLPIRLRTRRREDQSHPTGSVS